MPKANAKPELDIRLIQAQTRLLKGYSGVRASATRVADMGDGRGTLPRPIGGWRALASEVGVNHRYIYDLCVHGIAPPVGEVRDAILAWRPGGAVVKVMTPLEKQIFDMLRSDHVGARRGIHKRELLRALYGDEAAANESYNNMDDRAMREAIVVLNCDYGAMICSTPKYGYFWASSLKEGLEVVAIAESRAHTQLSNASHLKRNMLQTFGGQMDLGV